MTKVALPFHLRNLAGIPGDVDLDLAPGTTVEQLLEALEERYPVLRGTIREHVTLKRRPWIRFFACQQDLSHDPVETPLPKAVLDGEEPFMVVGAISGG